MGTPLLPTILPGLRRRHCSGVLPRTVEGVEPLLMLTAEAMWACRKLFYWALATVSFYNAEADRESTVSVDSLIHLPSLSARTAFNRPQGEPSMS